MRSATATEDKRVLRVDCASGGRDVLREVLEYRVGPPADWTFIEGTCLLVGDADRVDEDLKRRLMGATFDLQQEYSNDGIYGEAEEADRLESELSRTDIETWDEATVDVATRPPRDLSFDELHDEYAEYLPLLRPNREKTPANYRALQRRAVAIWAAIRERVDERPPECSRASCDAHNWTPAFTEPVECARCGKTVHAHGMRANPDLVEDVFASWQSMIAPEGGGRDE